jgi:hypothetical protein
MDLFLDRIITFAVIHKANPELIEVYLLVGAAD